MLLRSAHRATSSGRVRLLVLNWRDTDHPEGGGSELYVEEVATRLHDVGFEITLFSAHYAGAARREIRDGVRHIRRGGHLTVYLWAALLTITGRLGRPDVVLEVQNGMPFLSRLYARCPVVVLVHHVHREQWPVVGPTLAKAGWFLESTVAPWVNRHCRYLTVSEVTKTELASLGVAPDRVSVARNGLPAPEVADVPRSETPRLAVLSRLVPHKQIEHAIETVARLRGEFPQLTLCVMGSGWWDGELRRYADRAGVSDAVYFLGHVDEHHKHAELARAWVHLLPSVKEGWGLSIIEAAAHATPSVAYYSAGGVRESIQDRVTGLLATGRDDFVDCVRSLLDDDELREGLGDKAAVWAKGFDWSSTTRAARQTLVEAIGQPV